MNRGRFNLRDHSTAVASLGAPPTVACACGSPSRILTEFILRRPGPSLSDTVARLNTALEGRYRVERQIGEGGMATVYLASDVRHKRNVALKVLKPDLAAVVGAERFLTEIETTAKLQHPNILPLHDSGEADSFLYYVMPYVEGRSLRERLDREGPLSIDEASDIAAKVAGALQAAHDQGVIHRDVKPSNILLSRGEPLVADFGIALAVEASEGTRLTGTGTSVGTVSYMSPEQGLEDDRVDARSDIYSLGCVLYEMLVGDPPFAGSNAMAVLVRKSTDDVPRIRSVRSTVPERLEAVVLKALQRVPADRYPSAGDFQAALRSARRDTEGTASGAVAVPPAASSGKRKPRIGVLATVAIAAIAVIASGVGLFSRASGTESDLDRDRVIVFPLRVSEGYGGPPSIGEDVATLIVNALDGAGTLRWIDGLARLEPQAGGRFRPPGLADARRLARAAGAARFVTGSVTPTGGDRLTLALTLYETTSGELLSTAAADPATASEAWRAGLRAANRLLSQLIDGAPDVELEWQDREPRAIASFLQGEAAFRRVRLEEALAHYRDAAARDSAFALALIRGAQAAAWGHREAEAASMMERVVELPLPARHADFARGYAAYLRGDAHEALTSLTRAVSADPGMAEAWLQIGETYTHLLPRTGEPDSLALSAFEEARRLDPKAGNILLHAIEIRLRNAEIDRAEPLLSQFLAAEPDSAFATKLEIMHRCVRDGPRDIDWDGIATATPFPLTTASKSLSVAASQPECAIAGYRAILEVDTSTTDVPADGRRWASLIGLSSLLIARGRPLEAEGEIDSFVERWGYGTTLLVFQGIVEDALAPRAREEAQHVREQYDGPYEGWSSDYRLWVVGALEATHGDVDEAATIADELSRRATAGANDRTGMMARSIRAHVALARGDTAEAMSRLEELVPPILPGDDLSWDEFAPLGLERLALARLLLANGDYLQAIRVAEVFDSPSPHIYAVFAKVGLQLRLEAARRIPNQLLASRYRARLEALGN
jgi:tetratricopeptide (TPR) repeat protein/tRNA A-37 threonylcarbamoyl transferase component Bud32